MKSADIGRLLPGVYQRVLDVDPLLGGLLDAMESLLDPVEETLATLPDRFDPRRCDPPWIRLLARWVDVDPDQAAPGRLAERVARAAELHAEVGTRHGLERLLFVATGWPLQVLEHPPPGHDDRPFTMWIVGPPGSGSLTPLVRWIVDREKPAHMDYVLVLTD